MRRCHSILAITISIVALSSILAPGGDARESSRLILATPQATGGWQRLSDPPFYRSGELRLWTGDGLFVWSGEARAHSFSRTGAFYNAETRRWQLVPAAPIAGRVGAAAVWTGSHVLVWGGSDGSSVFANGASYDIRRHAWTVLPKSPLSARMPAAWVWTGHSFLIWGDSSVFHQARDGAAYDPATKRWTELQPAPFALNQVSAVWAEGQMLIYGAELDSSNQSRTKHALGISYRPASNQWTTLPEYPLSPQASAISSTGGRVIAFDYTLHAAMFSLQLQRWERIGSLPLTASECYPSSAVVQRFTVAWYCGIGAILGPDSREWHRLSPPSKGLALDEPVAARSSALFTGTARQSQHPELWAYTPTS